MVRDFQSIIGKEAHQQCLKQFGALPDLVVACVGGGSNAMGIFHEFVPLEEVRLLGIEAGGFGVKTGKHAAPLTVGRPGILHGSRTYLMQSAEGQIEETHSVSAGLDYPGVGPEHSYLKDIGRVEYTSVDDEDALNAFVEVSQTEGIIPALETSHALASAAVQARLLGKGRRIVVNLSGRGDKDLGHYFRQPHSARIG